jgi:hypothetical protein
MREKVDIITAYQETGSYRAAAEDSQAPLDLPGQHSQS